MAGFAAIFGAAPAHAEYAWNFQDPVTPLALDTLNVHNKFMLISLIIFFVVLAIMIYSIFAHRKSRGVQPANFTGPSTKSQVIWTLVPFALLLYIDFILMGIPAFHSVIMMEDTRTDADMVLKVTGSQWKWQYEYPAEGIKFVSTLATPRHARCETARSSAQPFPMAPGLISTPGRRNRTRRRSASSSTC
jgi:cytochrome c oxidase subunit 2